LAAELDKALGVKTELIQGRGGVFDVVVDGKKVFSKHDLARFPEEGEVLGLIRGDRKD
jgi:selT/selW/selH-like putative selenoprotein